MGVANLNKILIALTSVCLTASVAQAQAAQDVTNGQEHAPISATPVIAQPVQATPVAQSGQLALPASTLLQVSPTAQIRSSNIEEGDVFQFTVVQDVVENGFVVIPRGSIVQGTITWKTGRAIGGKSGKFDITWNHVSVGGRQFALQGVHRQEGRGNTLGAVLGSILISGRSAQLDPGNVVTAMTAVPIPYSTGG